MQKKQAAKISNPLLFPVRLSRFHFDACGVASALLIVMLLLLNGCQRSRSGAITPGKVVINYWNGFTGPDGKTMSALVRQFQQENPDIQVNMQLIPWGTYYDKLTLSLAYGGAPEVFILQAARFSEFASFHTLHALADLYASDPKPLGQNDFVPVAWKESFYQNTLYALPLDIHPIGLYYNTKLFREAGIVDAQGRAKPPANLTEFLEDAKRLTRDTNGGGRPDQWGFVITNQHSNWLTFAHQFGADVVSADGRRGQCLRHRGCRPCSSCVI